MSTPCQGTKRGRVTNNMHKFFKTIEATTSNVLFSSPSSVRNHEVPVVNYEPEEVEGTRRTVEVEGTRRTDFEEVEGTQRTDGVEGIQRTDFEEVEGTRRINLEELDTRIVPEVADSAYVTSLERDPGLRIPIMQHSANKHDEVRRAYLQMGRIRIKLAKYPGTPMGIQDRRFSTKWFDEFHWLEYSKAKDVVFCFYCYLFEKNPPRRPEYTFEGFRNWHNVKNGAKCAFLAHMGSSNSVHFTSVEAGENLKNPQQHISTIIRTQSIEIIRRNRLRFTISVQCALWLAFQQCPFRGHDESKNSKNRGNFLEMVRFSATLNDKVKEVVLENAPKNSTYTSPAIQKEILNIVSNEIRDKIREEIGDRKYCILVDESKDASDKEQMVLVLRIFPRCSRR
ncbi:zinc finger MYM-type protein 1-like isoform X2 [Papaver somniferum]|uniref:zinc finger MYM-type protein 1-like isoform X2 n=1 Tax=Papaver somniferum TaxID=3469 RepID=UPI000E704BC9|nr:zinc finger MYM-type protein 1-like isoform X2 [Papaver somniferum]